MSRTLEQKRATYALEFVTTHSSDKAKLFTHIQKTPIRILQNGLGQSLAFLLADAKSRPSEPSHKLYTHLQDWLCGFVVDDWPCRVYNGQSCNLMEQLVKGDRNQYTLAQEESLRLFTWLKKFADAYLKGENPDAP